MGVAVEQIDVKPTISLNSIVTFSWCLTSIVSPTTIQLGDNYEWRGRGADRREVDDVSKQHCHVLVVLSLYCLT